MNKQLPYVCVDGLRVQMIQPGKGNIHREENKTRIATI
jgi:hypothetical protein